MDNIRNRELFEIKDDEEQKSKLQDICDLLLAAGYFRVRLKGISAFDKVVGGIVWCLEMSAIDIDVNFLFRENLNIGEKIEITEKIIHVLISIKCAYTLEPHQIQGLDTVKIYPVVQWLVKKAMETRELLSDHLKSVASLQYQKHFERTLSRDKSSSSEEIVRNIQQSFLPHRRFKKITSNAFNDDQQVISTMMEYGVLSNCITNTEGSSTQVEQEPAQSIIGTKKAEQRTVALCVSNLINQQAELIAKAIDDYTQRQTEREMEKDELQQLQEDNKSLSDALHKIISTIDTRKHESSLLLEEEQRLDFNIKELVDKRESLSSIETDFNKPFIAKMDDVARQNEQISLQRKEFKNQCKIRLQEMRCRNENLGKQCETMADKDLEEMQHKSNAMKEQLSNGQKMLSERNMACMKLLRQLDAVPGNSELNQYQRRFTELCFQVNEKQTELNGYYLLYNTLEDSKVYLNKELSLLTSIHDKFGESMIDSFSKTEFLHQMENIVSAVRQNRNKLAKQIEAQMEKCDNLNTCISELAKDEQLYRDTLKLIAQESHKYKLLLSRSN